MIVPLVTNISRKEFDVAEDIYKVMKSIFVFALLTNFLNFVSIRCFSQQSKKIDFGWNHDNKRYSDTIKFFVKNNSKYEKYFYSIFLQGYNDTTWVPLLSDINSLGMNEFTVLKPLLPGAKATKTVSKEKIKKLYLYQELSKIRFGLMFYKKKDLKSAGEMLLLEPLDL